MNPWDEGGIDYFLALLLRKPFILEQLYCHVEEFVFELFFADFAEDDFPDHFVVLFLFIAFVLPDYVEFCFAELNLAY